MLHLLSRFFFSCSKHKLCACPYVSVHMVQLDNSFFYFRELGDHGKACLCLALLALERHFWPKQLLPSVVQHSSTFLLLLWLQNGVGRVNVWCDACLILQELMLQVQSSLMRLILSAMPGGKSSLVELCF